ncbi:MAG: hypothetical protein Q4D51_01555 [Eubacteriales bacterium]|nr:hypothetical protein [Eubacteriales bacterium]
MGVIGALLGIAFGVVLAYLIISIMVKKSNDLGDSKGNYKDFSTAPVVIHESKNNVSQNFIPPEYS